MSLKAKIEAVIYASEEPVTLAQLAGLLGHEAQAELDHLDSAQHALALEEAASDEDELNSEVFAGALDPETEAEAEHAEALKRHLHDAAAEEAAHARAVRMRAAAATAAMSSADSVEPFLAEFGIVAATAEQGSDAPVITPSEDDEKKTAREARERERR